MMMEMETLTTKTTPARRRRLRPRIAMVSTHGYVAANPPLGAPDTGGQVVYVLELSRKLAQLGFKVDIWTRRFEEQPEREVVDENVTILRMPCGGKDFIPKETLVNKLPEWVEHALRYIDRHDYSYQFINSHYWDAGVASQKMAEALGIPHVHTPHSLGAWKRSQMKADAPEEVADLDKKYNFPVRIREEQALYRACDLVVATSPQQFDLLRSDYNLPADTIRMIPPGYDDTRFFPVSTASRQALRESFGYQGKVIFSLGRLARNKGFDLLIPAFEVAAARKDDVWLHLAVGQVSSDPGNSPLLEEMRGLISQSPYRDRIVLSDSVSDEELADRYRAADVFALSSRYEPFGMTAVEALACGTPTVVTTHGGLYRALDFGVHAIYADTLDKEEFGIALLQATKYDRLRERLGRLGSQRARSLFTWTGIAQQVLRELEDRLSPESLLDPHPSFVPGGTTPSFV